MTYTPLKYVIVEGTTLSESSDLSVALSTFQTKEAYLIVVKNSQQYSLSISQILLYHGSIDITLPLSSALPSVLTDMFVETYSALTIPTKMKSGYYDKRLRVFNPISYKDYSVNFTSTNTPEVVNDVYMKGYLDDLVITSPTEDITNCLVAVNGVFHKTNVLNNHLYVMDGFRTMRLCGRKDITVVDTSSIGGHTVIPLTTTNVHHTTFNEWATITLPSSIKDKTLAIVIDGYMYHLDSGILSVVDETHVKVKTNLLQLVQQYRHNPRTMYSLDRLGEDASQHSRRYSDTYATAFIGNRSLPSSLFHTVDFQLSRLTHYHSFLVVFNAQRLYTVEAPILTTGTPRFYYDYSDNPLSGMMSYGYGLCPSYLIHNESGGRKKILVSGQDDDIDYQDLSYNPLLIPAITPTPVEAADVPARFIDYIFE
jgi:hypothetical protein